MSKLEPLVSVVMPVYNGEATLDRAIASVLAQTHRELECVVLDNCSADRTGEIAARHADQDARVRVHRNSEVVPVMKNHNVVVGLASEQAAYCQILQADDTLAPECLQRKVAVGEANPSVAIIGAYSQWRGTHRPLQMPEGERFDGPEICRRTLLGEIYPFISPSSVLFRSTAVASRRPFYNEAAVHGDVQACYEILEKADFGFVHDTLTTIGQSEASVTSRVYRPLNRLIAANLSLLVDYGPRFLDAQTYRARLESQLDVYYRHLAAAALERRGRDFWDFHRSALASSGVPMSTRRLLSALLHELRHRPRNSARRFVRSFGSESA